MSMNYSDGGINFANIMAYIQDMPPEFQKKFAPYYQKFLFNNILKKQIPYNIYGKQNEDGTDSSILQLLYGG